MRIFEVTYRAKKDEKELEAQKDYFTFDNYIILSDVEREIKRSHTYDEIEIYRIDIKK